MMVSRVVDRVAAAMFSAEFTNAAAAIWSIDQPTALREYASRTTQQKHVLLALELKRLDVR